MSAEQLLKSARQACPTMALTTVYRNLEQLMAQESVQRIMYPDGTARYEAVQAVHHHYLICMECKKSIQLPMCPVNQLEQSIISETGYEITSHNLELFGYCPACQQIRKQRQQQQNALNNNPLNNNPFGNAPVNGNPFNNTPGNSNPFNNNPFGRNPGL